MKKIISLLLLLVIGFSCIQQSKEGIAITLDTNQINSFLKKEFPVEKELKVGKLIVKEAKVLSIENKDRINLGSEISYKPPLLPEISGKAQIAGGIKYDPEKKAIFLKNPEIKQLKFFGKDLLSFVPESSRKILFNALGEIFTQIPVYKFSDKKLIYRFVKDIKVEEGKIKLLFGI
jgi:chaperone required for assembly of F1-ATPase